MRILSIFIGIGVILVIAAILLLRNKKTEAFVLPFKGKCPRGTGLKYIMMRGKRKGVCVGNPGGNALDKYVSRNYPYWGWGVHEGLKCKYNDNTGCNTVYRDGKLYMKYGS